MLEHLAFRFGDLLFRMGLADSDGAVGFHDERDSPAGSHIQGVRQGPGDETVPVVSLDRHPRARPSVCGRVQDSEVGLESV